MRLFIAEKPELGRAIAEALGGGTSKKGHIVCGQDIVTWCFGHMLKLYEPEDYDAKYKKWSFADLPLHFIPWRKKALEKSKEQLAIIKELLDQAQSVVNAGDPDPEGQLLIDELLEHFKNRKPVKRVLINDNNAALVKKAINSMGDNAAFAGMSKAAEARQVADQLWGFNMSRAYTLAVQTNRKLADDAPAITGVTTISVGRVQTPVLGLVVNRTAENRNHQKAFFYTVTGAFNFGGDTINGRLQVADEAPADEKGRITDPEYANSVIDEVAGKPATLYDVTTTAKETPPPLPFNLLKLQSLAASRWHMKPDRVKDITQKLREEYKLITYNRSDCQYLSEEQHADALEVIAAIGKNIGQTSLVKTANPEIKSRAFDSSKVSAHHAIIPTMATPDMAKLTKDEANIYDVIAEYYLMQFLPNYKYAQTKITITCGEKHAFSHTSNKATDQGWKGIAASKDEEDASETDEDGTDAAPAKEHKSGEKGECASAKAEKQETKPKPLYTMSTLLTDLAAVAKYVKNPELKKTLLLKDKGKEGEHGGIGTAATRDEIIKTLFTREFITEEKIGKKTVIVPTEAGNALYASLPDVARTPDLTALWHQDFIEIERGGMKQKDFIEKLIANITGEVNRVKAIPANTSENTVFCPKCESVLAKRTGKNGPFWACIDRDNCGATYPDKDGEPDFTPREPRPAAEERPCPKCGGTDGGKIRKIEGKYGAFWGCSNRDNCGATYPDKDGEPDTSPKPPKMRPSKTYTCKSCGSGLVRRKSGKSNEYFWGCSAYPKCKQTYPEKNEVPDYTAKEAKK